MSQVRNNDGSMALASFAERLRQGWVCTDCTLTTADGQPVTLSEAELFSLCSASTVECIQVLSSNGKVISQVGKTKDQREAEEWVANVFAKDAAKEETGRVLSAMLKNRIRKARKVEQRKRAWRRKHIAGM